MVALIDDVRVSPSEVLPTHHVSLRNPHTGEELGLMLHINGIPDARGMTVAGTPRMVERIAEGDPKYSDYNMPYTPVTQKDWSGGRGQKWFDDKSRFADNHNTDTSGGSIRLGPKAMGAFDLGKTGRHYIVNYKGARYIITNPDDATTPKIYLNGYRGAATTNSADKNFLNTGLTLTANQLVGCVAMITGGTGDNEDENWRVITANDTTGHCYCDHAWVITHDITTEFVIIGLNNWTEITGHGLTGPITGKPLVFNDIIYVPQGASVKIQRLREYNNAGTWKTFADAACHAAEGDAEAYAHVLLECPKDDGALQLWRFCNETDLIVAACSDKKAWGTNLDFANEIVTGNLEGKTKGALAYGDPLIPWVLKTNEFGSIANTKYAPKPLANMKAVASDYNGSAFVMHDKFFYFSLLEGLERYINDDLQDMGVNTGGEGMPANRRGKYRDLYSYPGRIFCAYDAGSGGYSSILTYNMMIQHGWSEYYRAEKPGDQIRSIDVQVTPPSNQVDRLWFIEGQYVKWLSVSMDSLKRDGFKYQTTGDVETSRFYSPFLDIRKFFNELQLELEDIVADHLSVEVAYRTNIYDTYRYLTNDDNNFLVYCGNQIVLKVTEAEHTKVYRSIDDGYTFDVVAALTTTYSIISMDSDGAGNVIVATSNSASFEVKKSADYGATFSDAKGDLAGVLNNDFGIAKVISSSIFILGDGAPVDDFGTSAIWRTTNGGTNWTKIVINIGSTDQWVTHIVRLESSNVLVAALNLYYVNPLSFYRSLYKSTDNGATWTAFANATAHIHTTAMCAVSSNLVLMGDTFEGYKTYVSVYDYSLGTVQSQYFTLPATMSVRNFVNAGGGRVYMVVTDNGINDAFYYLSEDYGYTWQAIRTVTGGVFAPTNAPYEQSTNIKLSDERVWFGYNYCYDGATEGIFQIQWTETYIPITGYFETEPSARKYFSPDMNVYGNWIQLRLTLNSDDENFSPEIRACTAHAVTRVPPKMAWQLPFFADDVQATLDDRPITLTADQVNSKIMEFSNSDIEARPLILHSLWRLFDDYWVFVSPASVRPLELMYTQGSEQRKQRIVGQFTLTQA